MNASSRVDRPILRVVVPLLAAILLANAVALPLWVSLIAIFVGGGWLALRGDTVAIYIIIFGFGLVVATPTTTPSHEPLTTATEFALRPLNSYRAEVVAFRDEAGEWRKSGAQLYISSSEGALASDSLAICSARYSSPTGEPNSARLYISALESTLPLSDFGIRPSLGARLQRWALARVETLDLAPTTGGSVVAMALGERSYLDYQIVEDYRRSGTAHLLALSGMHIGVVFLILRALLYLFPLLRYGHIIGDVATIIFIWIFALMAGFSDSIVRASAMFSLLQISHIISRRYDSLTSLIAVVTVMLLFDTSSLYDLGFQLSVVAVAAIIIFAIPLTKRLQSRSRIINTITSSVVMGIIATIATAPLIAYHFGYIALLSPIVTLPMLATLSTIIISTVVWILLPLPLLAPLFREVITVTTTIQNFIAGWAAQLEWGYFEYSITKFEVAIIYAIYLSIAIATSYLLERRVSQFSFQKALRQLK